jgi:hypothetical protein
MGSVVTLQKDGFVAGAIGNKLPSLNTYKDGQIRPDAVKTGTAVADKVGGILGQYGVNVPRDKVNQAEGQLGPTIQFPAGQSLYVTRIKVDRGTDRIVFELISDPVANQGRFRGSLAIPFRPGSLASADLSQMKPQIDQMLSVQAADQSAPGPVTPATPDKPLAPDAPPPPPPHNDR